MPAFEGLILAVTDAIARTAAGLRVPDPMGDADVFIAATALQHNLTIVTRNVDDFERARLRVLNPWERGS